MTDCGEVDGEREDDQRHDPEHSLHGSKVGVVDAGLCPQLKKDGNDVKKKHG